MQTCDTCIHTFNIYMYISLTHIFIYAHVCDTYIHTLSLTYMCVYIFNIYIYICTHVCETVYTYFLFNIYMLYMCDIHTHTHTSCWVCFASHVCDFRADHLVLDYQMGSPWGRLTGPLSHSLTVCGSLLTGGASWNQPIYRWLLFWSCLGRYCLSFYFVS